MTDQDPRPGGSTTGPSDTAEEPMADQDRVAVPGEGMARTSEKPPAADASAAGDEPAAGVDLAAADGAAADAGATSPALDRPGERARPSPGRPVDELPYVDDPVTKWWVAIVVAVFVAVFAYALLLGRGGLLSDLLDGAAPEPSLAPIASIEPSPSPEPSLTAGPSPRPPVAAGSPSPMPALPSPTPVASAPPPTPAPTAAVAGSSGPPAESPAPAG